MQWTTNKLLDLKKQYAKELCAFYEQKETEALLSILIQHFFGMSRSELLVNSTFRLSESEILKLHFAVKELKKYRPVQYIVGETEFFGLKIKVNDSVLIPRPETEELVQLIVDNHKEVKLNILDIGTGSGCIAIALQKNLHEARLTAIDNSSTALKLASENCTNNKAIVNLKEINILEQKQWENFGNFDIIVSNPPYVRDSEKKGMKENVLKYEPHQALFVPDNNALVFYETIIEFSRDHLNENGKIYFEINEAKGNEVVELAKTNNFKNVVIHKDIHGRSRFISGTKN